MVKKWKRGGGFSSFWLTYFFILKEKNITIANNVYDPIYPIPICIAGGASAVVFYLLDI